MEEDFTRGHVPNCHGEHTRGEESKLSRPDLMEIRIKTQVPPTALIYTNTTTHLIEQKNDETPSMIYIPQ